MPSLEMVAQVSALVSALADGYNLARPAFEALLARRKTEITPETLPPTVILYFNTFSDDEMEDIERRLRGCRDRFIEQGAGGDRRACLCSVLRQVDAGNNGLPEGDWKNLADQLGCLP